MRYMIEYYDKELRTFEMVYIMASNDKEAVEIFRKQFYKEHYDIEGVYIVVEKDWSES